MKYRIERIIAELRAHHLNDPGIIEVIHALEEKVKSL
jgi:hypothetical protein